MKVPLIWLKDYIDTDKSAAQLAASFTQLGLMLDKPLDSKNVLDLEHRMDRADWLSILGCARDLAAFENVKLKLPKLSGKPGKPATADTKITINIDTPVVRRFQTRVIKGIKVGPSPKWIVDRLTAYGMESINNIVDITNFVMIEYGQPMHAQDIAKLPGKDITIRKAKPGESLTTLLGTEIKLSEDTHVLTSGNQPIVILGVVGGKATGVTSETRDIILDSGNYDSRVIRKSSRQLKIMNETVSRDDKFLDPRTIDLALARATDLILEIAGGTYYANDDYYPTPAKSSTQTLRSSRLALLSGMDISLATAKKILKSLEYSIVEESESELTVEIPYFRTDIEVEDDLIADILRITNYTNIPQIPISSPVPRDITPQVYRFEDTLRDLLVAQGAHEHITNSLTQSTGSNTEVKLANALSSDQNALRNSLVPRLTQAIKNYKKHKINTVPLFEIGKVFEVNGDKYLEGRLLTIVFPKVGIAQNSLASLFTTLGITNYEITNSLTIKVTDKLVGNISATTFTLVTDALMSLSKPYSGIVSDFSHNTSLDLSLMVPSSLKYADISGLISGLKGEWQSISCKSMTKLGNQNNYLLTITWDSSSKQVDSDKVRILTELEKEFGITSKS